MQLRVAVELDDSATHDSLVEELEARLPCAAFPPSRQLWAEFMVHEALRAFAAGGDWQTPLTAALRAFPEVDREVGPSHPMATFAPPPAEPVPSHAELAPAGMLLFVDGEGALALPPASGIHLVQKSDGQWWSGRLLEGEALPGSWLSEPIRPPPHTAVWIDLAAFGGVAGRSQIAAPEADYYEDPSTAGGGAGLRVGARTAFRSPFGVAGAAFVPVAPASSAGSAEGRLGPSVSGGPFWASIGAGLAAAPVWEGRAIEHFRLLYPYIAAGAQTSGAWSLTAEAGGGAAAAVRTGEARVGVVAPAGSWRPRAGIRAEATSALLDAATVRVTADDWAIGAEVGATWGTER